MNKEYQIIRCDLEANITIKDNMTIFNNKLAIFKTEQWNQFGEPSLSRDHTYLTLILWREVSSNNGPYR